MRTHVQFTSDAFPPYPGEDEQINPGIWGKRLAEFLASRLAEHGVATSEFYMEDWGWEIPVENEAFPIFIGCSNQLEPDGNVFHCLINPSKPVMRRWFKKVSTVDDVERVAALLDVILGAHPGIGELRWWSDDEA
ncbi:MAG: hypothetical protein KF861_06795 [Planctomycetaceae bacterium]|nr:hypothetical protein [Planctomycetaceae bacterium]